MTQPSSRHIFSLWDGSQQLPLDAEAIIQALADDLLETGDLRWAMRKLLTRGMNLPDGKSIQGLQNLLRQLRQKKQAQLQRYDLDSLFEDINKRLDEILDMERRRIDQWRSGNIDADKQTDLTSDQDSELNTEQSNDAFSVTNEVFRRIAEQSAETLDALPNNLPGRINALERYEFLDTDAQKLFLALLNELRQAVANMFFKDVENLVKNLSDGDIDRMRDMLSKLNEMLAKKIAGEEPNFEEFMNEFGDMFGDTPPQNLDELLEQMQKQMAAARSLLNSLPPDQQAALQQLLGDRLGNSGLQSAMSQLAKALNFLSPGSTRYRFSGDESLSLNGAMDLMQDLQRMDDLQQQLERAEQFGGRGEIDRDLLEDMLGPEAGDQLDQLEKIQKALEEAGYLRTNEDDQIELTPRGSRIIGQRALGEIYQRLKRQNLGNHAIPEEGRFGERLEQTKAYAFGDPMHLHLSQTLRNGLARNGISTPVKLHPDDFEIYRSEQITSTATAMLVDLSWSMALRGSFQAAKRVALALHNLITSQYPKDSFYIIGFAASAKELKPKDLPFLQWDEYVLGTNMQEALMLAQQLLAKHSAGSKQIIMISDGEPTAHTIDGQVQFAYPPTSETIRATLRAVKHCTRRGIAINTFMLETSAYLRAFMDEIARINGGRVFFTDADNLGEYVLVDYVENKRKRLGGRR